MELGQRLGFLTCAHWSSLSMSRHRSTSAKLFISPSKFKPSCRLCVCSEFCFFSFTNIAYFQVWWFSIAAVTNHKFSSLNNTNASLSYRPVHEKSNLGPTGIQVSAGLLSFLEIPGENLSLCPFQLLEDTRIPWFMAPFFHLQSSHAEPLCTLLS